MRPSSTELDALLKAEIRREGVVSFARFMELALYCPELGYYEQKCHTPGRRGDFYTGVSVGPMLGELLGYQFGVWADDFVGEGGAFQIVEAGAHDGRLAADCLAWMARARPALAERMVYWILEPSARRRAWQEECLRSCPGRVRWCSGWDDLPGGQATGVIFGNELLDAFPVHRIGWDALRRQWFEWGVGLGAGGMFEWERMPGVAAGVLSLLPSLTEQLEEMLPAGFGLEVSPQAVNWWRRAAESLCAGRLLALDYGLEEHERLMPSRSHGTLRAYAGHRRVDQVLATPGQQDLTAHVQWDAVKAAGEAAGLVTEVFEAQGRFLTQLAVRAWRGGQTGFGEWTAQQTRQFQALTHPAHLGMKFQVLVQRRAAPPVGEGG